MPSPWLAAGTGAYKGLRQIMEDNIAGDARARAKEVQDRNFALEQERLKQTGDLQRMTQSRLAASDAEHATDHADDNSRMMLQLTPPGTTLTPEERQRFGKVAPSGMFQDTPATTGGMSQPDQAGPEQPAQSTFDGTRVKPTAASAGVVKQDKNGNYYRVMPDNSATPITKDEAQGGGPLSAWHAPQQEPPGVWTADGYIPRSAALHLYDPSTGQGAAPAPTANQRNRSDIAATVQPTLADVKTMATQLDSRGQFGPVMSRLRHLAERVGTLDEFTSQGVDSTGDPDLDYLVGQFSNAVALAASGAGMAHYQGRAGSSPAAMQSFRAMLNDSSSIQMFMGRLDELDKVMGRYATGAGAGGRGRTPTPAPGAGGTPLRFNPATGTVE